MLLEYWLQYCCNAAANAAATLLQRCYTVVAMLPRYCCNAAAMLLPARMLLQC
jgi:hypothetical protein